MVRTRRGARAAKHAVSNEHPIKEESVTLTLQVLVVVLRHILTVAAGVPGAHSGGEQLT